MILQLLLTLLCLLPLALQSALTLPSDLIPPKYLYKITSMENWTESQQRPVLKLLITDDNFIHLATENDLERIMKKYCSDFSEVVILKLETEKLQGKLVYESNPGGTNKYYHLYNGSIPRDAVVESKILHRDSSGAFVSY